MRKTLTYSSFVIASLVVIAVFVTATTYTQLGAAILLYPLLAYFAFKILPRKTWKAPVLTIQVPAKSTEKVKEVKRVETKEDIKVADFDKRAFLKLIGAAGLSFFFFSLLNRKVGDLFFGRSAEAEITRQPTEGYRISEIDENDSTFYGFINKSGNWFIMKENVEGSFRYTKGDLDFSNNWSNREQLQYNYFHEVF